MLADSYSESLNQRSTMCGFETFDMPDNLVVIQLELLVFSCFRVPTNAQSRTRNVLTGYKMCLVFISAKVSLSYCALQSPKKS